MQTNNEIVKDVYTSDWFNKMIKKICKSQPQFEDDLKQEVTLILLTYDNEKLNTNLNYIRFFTARIAMNQIASSSSPFYKLYRKDNAKHIDMNIDLTQVDINDSEYVDEFAEEVNRYYAMIRPKLYWYDAELFDIYIKLGSYRKVAEATGIPLRSVGQNLKATREIIQRELKILNKKENEPIKIR